MHIHPWNKARLTLQKCRVPKSKTVNVPHAEWSEWIIGVMQWHSAHMVHLHHRIWKMLGCWSNKERLWSNTPLLPLYSSNTFQHYNNGHCSNVATSRHVPLTGLLNGASASKQYSFGPWTCQCTTLCTRARPFKFIGPWTPAHIYLQHCNCRSIAPILYQDAVATTSQATQTLLPCARRHYSSVFLQHCLNLAIFAMPRRNISSDRCTPHCRYIPFGTDTCRLRWLPPFSHISFLFTPRSTFVGCVFGSYPYVLTTLAYWDSALCCTVQ